MTLADVCAVLEIAPPDFALCSSQAHAQRVLDQWKGAVARHRRVLAARHHPDKGGDPERMKLINAAADEAEKVRLEIRRPQPRVVSVRYHPSMSYTWSSSSTATASATTTVTFS